MGLQVNYNDSRGREIENSYWVVSDLKFFKRLNDTSNEARDALPEGVEPDRFDTIPGYYVNIVVFGWDSKSDRDAGEDPKYIRSVLPTDYQTIFSAHEKEESYDYRFEYDILSSDSIITQAYQHLLNNVEIFSSATQD